MAFWTDDEPRTTPMQDNQPCPTCGQFSHSLGSDDLAEAFNHFEGLLAHPMRGTPMGHAFDERTRWAAQVLMASARSVQDNQNTVEAVADLMVECLPSSLEDVERCSLLATAEAVINTIAAMRAVEPAGEAVAYRYVHRDYAGRKVSLYGSHPKRVNGHDPIEVHPLYTHPSPADQSALVAELMEALSLAEWTMDMAHERMGKFAKADVGIHGGACPKYGEQELRVGLSKIRRAITRARQTGGAS